MEGSAHDSRLVAYYEIYAPPGSASGSAKDTGYYVDMYAFVPYVGKNDINCIIKRKDSNAPPLVSPYACAYNWTDADPHSVDPQPHWKLTAKPQVDVTDLDQAVGLLNAHCSAEQTPECGYKATSQQVEKAPRSDWQLYGVPYQNCNVKPDEPHSLSIDRSLSWSDSIQVKTSAKFNLGPVTAEIDAQYKHTVTAKYDIKEVYGTKVAYHKLVGFYIIPGYLRITGDWLVTTMDTVYSIKDFTMRLPLGSEYSPPEHPELHFEPAIITSVEIADADCPSGGAAIPPSSLPQGSPPPAGAVVTGPEKIVSSPQSRSLS
jgi:hypothetical protein